MPQIPEIPEVTGPDKAHALRLYLEKLELRVQQLEKEVFNHEHAQTLSDKLDIVIDLLNGKGSDDLTVNQVIRIASVALCCKTELTYTQLFRYIPSQYREHSHLKTLLDAVADKCLSHGWPIITAVFIKDSGLSGSGFFGYARKLGRAGTDEHIWHEEMRRLREMKDEIAAGTVEL